MSASITLAGREYALPPALLLGEIKKISGIVMREAPKDPEQFETAQFDNAVETLVIANARTYPELTSAFIYSQAITPQELWEARNAVLILAGLIRKDAKVGEEKPGQDGIGSTENSAPASE